MDTTMTTVPEREVKRAAEMKHLLRLIVTDQKHLVVCLASERGFSAHVMTYERCLQFLAQDILGRTYS